MRKGIVGDFKNFFDEQLEAEFDEFVKKRLANSDFRFAFE